MMRLREITRDDIKVINGWRNDLELISKLGTNFRYINEETDDNWFDNYMHNRKTNIRCAILYDEKMVGVVYLTNIDEINRCAEFHIMIGEKEVQGKGIGTYATKEMLNHAFNNLNLNRIGLTVLDDNVIALKLYEKMGFKKEGVLRETLYKNGKYHDQLIMSILKKEFKE